MSDRDLCNHHPKQVHVGVCPFCLNDRLLAIAANQQQQRRSHHRNCSEGVIQPSHSRKPSHGGLLAFGSLLSRLELRCRSHHQGGSYDFDGDVGGSDSQSTSLSLEDSFISIKFEENGVASWDKSKESETSWNATIDHKGIFKEGNWKSYSNKSVGEHTKAPERSLRWRKRIGHLLQLVKGKRLKKPNGGASHDSCVDGLGEALKVRME